METFSFKKAPLERTNRASILSRYVDKQSGTAAEGLH